jgi:tetratricopeptide (TPR) repeat protein
MDRTKNAMAAAVLGLCLTIPGQQASSVEPAPALCVSRPGSAAALPTTLPQWAEGAQLFDGLGDFRRKISTNSAPAQAYFDQGMRFLWAFNHDEATRSFAKAAQLDPQCAMCYWGVALTVGPNYNLPMMAEGRAKVARVALEDAVKYAASATAVEQALITALNERYPNAQPLDPSNEGPLLTAYAAAMKNVVARFPADDDVRTLAAEAMMNVNAWKLWRPNGEPTPGTQEIVAYLEAVMSNNPRHPGANHYYIHALEASPSPQKALAAAERLGGMMVAAGHLEHMPAHILQRVGRYADAAEANRKGAAADLIYFSKTTPPDYYAMYTAHNYQFLAFSTAMEGRRAETLQATRNSRGIISDDLLLAMPGLDWYVAEIYMGMVRFGLWDDIINEPAPNPRLAGMTGGYLYAKATAFAAQGRLEDARAQLIELEKLVTAAAADDSAGLNSFKDVLTVAVLTAQGRIARAEGKHDEAIALFSDAAAKEDSLAYDEPADWFFPVRHLLGAELLQAGKTAEAEAVYRDDLRRTPGNGWALFGLTQTLKAQGRDADATSTQGLFEAAWRNADIQLTTSAF